jgi:hypothetical protein
LRLSKQWLCSGYLLGHRTVYFVEGKPTFRRNISPTTSRSTNEPSNWQAELCLDSGFLVFLRHSEKNTSIRSWPVADYDPSCLSAVYGSHFRQYSQLNQVQEFPSNAVLLFTISFKLSATCFGRTTILRRKYM